VQSQKISTEQYGSSPWQDREILKELYHEKDLTQEEIAELLGCGEGTVNRWVHKFDFEVNPIGSTNETIREVDLDTLYWEEGLSQKEIAEKCDCSVALVSKQMSEQNIPVRGGYDGEMTVYTGSQQGYQRMYVRDGDSTKKCLVHRLIAVAEYGYDEVVDNVVHHINEVKWDNRPSNLTVMSNAEHASHHHPSNQ